MSQRKFSTQLSAALVRSVGEQERRLYAKRGVSIRVSSIAHDERTLICNVFQQRRATLSKPLDTVEMVGMAEPILAPLLSVGFTPMITAVDWTHAEDLRNAHDRPDELDPIGLVSALRDSGLPFPRLNSTTENAEDLAIAPVSMWRKAFSMFAAW